MKIVKIIKDEVGWKGTWYKTGELHAVNHTPKYGQYTQLGTTNGISVADCKLLISLRLTADIRFVFLEKILSKINKLTSHIRKR